MKKLGILMIRGSGSPGFEEQDKFVELLFKALDKQGMRNPENVIATQVVNWYGSLEERQQELIRRMENSDLKIKGKILRRFLLSNITDLINYGGRPNQVSTTYDDTHKLVYRDIKKLQDQVEEGAPLLILASSMGTEIINNHIWDRQNFMVKNPGQQDPLGQTAFERMETLVGLFTFGNNIPIFATAFPIDDLQPIAMPASGLSDQLKSISKWYNFYDKNDPLGYPVTFVNQNYKRSYIEDVQQNVGNIFTFWNIASHFEYWKSRKICQRVCAYVLKVFNNLGDQSTSGSGTNAQNPPNTTGSGPT